MSASVEATGHSALHHTRAPLAAPAARPLAVLIALLLFGLAGVAVHDVLVGLDLLHRPPLLPGAARFVDAQRMEPATPWIAVPVAVLGLLLLIASVSPRRRTHLQVGEDAAVWIRPGDAARLCSARVLDLPGVGNARTRIRKRRAVVMAYAGGRDRDALEDAIREAVTPVLAHLHPTPALTVRLTHTETR